MLEPSSIDKIKPHVCIVHPEDVKIGRLMERVHEEICNLEATPGYDQSGSAIAGATKARLTWAKYKKDITPCSICSKPVRMPKNIDRETAFVCSRECAKQEYMLVAMQNDDRPLQRDANGKLILHG